MFVGLGLQGQPYGSLVSAIFEGSLNEERAGSGKAIFKGGFKFSASDASKNFDRADSALQRKEYQYASTCTQ